MEILNLYIEHVIFTAMASMPLSSSLKPRQNRRANPLLVLLIFLILAVGLLYLLILIWEIPSPSKTNVQCRLPDQGAHDVFQAQDAPADLLCEDGFVLPPNYSGR